MDKPATEVPEVDVPVDRVTPRPITVGVVEPVKATWPSMQGN